MLKVTLSDCTVIYVKCIGEALQVAHSKGLNVRFVE